MKNFYLAVESNDTVIFAKQTPEGLVLSINGHYLKEAKDVKVETFPDSVKVSFELPVKQFKGGVA